MPSASSHFHPLPSKSASSFLTQKSNNFLCGKLDLLSLKTGDTLQDFYMNNININNGA